MRILRVYSSSPNVLQPATVSSSSSSSPTNAFQRTHKQTSLTTVTAEGTSLSIDQTLRSWVRIPLGAWMCARVSCTAVYVRVWRRAESHESCRLSINKVQEALGRTDPWCHSDNTLTETAGISQMHFANCVQQTLGGN